MEEMVQLTLNDLLVERPFTDPDHVAADSAIMRTMAMQAWNLSSQIHSPVNYYPCPNAWQKRTMLFDTSAMRNHELLSCVGFFGNKRVDVSPDLEREVSDAGKKLCDALYDLSSMVCYITNLLADAHNYANFVVMKSPQTIEEWRKNEIHQSVTALLSPSYYYNVRIYTGTLSVLDSLCAFKLDLQSVKYFDYTQTEPWRAMRTLRLV